MTPDRFAAAIADTLIQADLDGLMAYFHRPSGQTHVVAEPVPAIIDALQTPAIVDDLLARLDIADADEEERDGLAQHLAALAATGLVSRV